MLAGSLVSRVLREVVKYFPPTFSVIQSEWYLLGTTAELCFVDKLTAAPSGMKPSPAETYKTSSSRISLMSSISPPCGVKRRFAVMENLFPVAVNSSSNECVTKIS